MKWVIAMRNHRGSGLSAQQQEMAFRLGANVICYAFSAYLAEVFGDKLNE